MISYNECEWEVMFDKALLKPCFDETPTPTKTRRFRNKEKNNLVLLLCNSENCFSFNKLVMMVADVVDHMHRKIRGAQPGTDIQEESLSRF